MSEGIETTVITAAGGIFVAIITLIGTIITKRKKNAGQPIVSSDPNREKNAPTIAIPQSAPAPKQELPELTSFTHHELADKIDAAPPLLRRKIEDSFVGLRVRWTGKLSDGYSSRDKQIVCLMGITYGGGVHCEAAVADCQKLIPLHEGAQVTVDGTIARIGKYEAQLKDCKFELPKQAVHQDNLNPI